MNEGRERKIISSHQLKSRHLQVIPHQFTSVQIKKYITSYFAVDTYLRHREVDGLGYYLQLAH